MNTPKTALLHIVDGHPMPNLLGVLGIRPELCVQLVPAGSHPRSNAFSEAVRTVLPATVFESVEFSVPRGRGISGAEIRKLVSAEINGLREAGYEPVVNVTGGSPVALGALAGAIDAKARAVYADTAAGEADALLVDPAGTGDPTIASDSGRIRETLSVGLVAAAHGVTLRSGPRDPEAFLECALKMAALGPKEWNELREVLPDAGALKLPERFLEMADKPVYLPAFARDIEAAALAAGVLTKSGSGALHLTLPGNEREALRVLARERAEFVRFSSEEWKARLAEGTASLLFNRDVLCAGGWFDILVWDHLRRVGRFRDVVWNPEIVTKHGVETAEGVFAIEGNGLAAFSCKPGGSISGLPQDAGVLASLAAHLGGPGGAKYLALALQPQNLNDVSAQAAAHGVKIIGDSRAFRPDSARDPFAGFKLPV